MYAVTDAGSLQPLTDAIASRPVVMLGEASHGTHEYYTWRITITKRLIEEKGFRFIAVEGDWPECYLINRYVKGYEDAGGDIREIMNHFDRWPTWMWANWEIVALIEWLRDFNKNLPAPLHYILCMQNHTTTRLLKPFPLVYSPYSHPLWTAILVSSTFPPTLFRILLYI